MALAAAQPRSTTGMGDTSTYFDSVVLLTMFLLAGTLPRPYEVTKSENDFTSAGRFIEAYSRGRTADAITALGRLRPSSALLVSASPYNAAEITQLSQPTLSIIEDPEKGDLDSEDYNLASKPGTSVKKINSELLEVGDVVRVLQGATPPADGTIVSGDGGAFDESSLTGESRLVKKKVGDRVFLGTINKAGVVDIRVDEIGGQTM